MTTETTPDPAGELPGSLFELDGEIVIPTARTQGPWYPGTQHGGPPAALLARAVEQVPTLVPMRVARLTIDLLRPVPVKPLRVATRIVREGKRLQLVESFLVDVEDEIEVAHVLALKVRTAETPENDMLTSPETDSLPAARAPWSPEEAHPSASRSQGPAVRFTTAIEIRRHAPEPGRPGITWLRALVPVMAGEPTTPTMRLAMFGDLTNSSRHFLDPARFAAINADVTIHVVREPAGEWIGVAATNWTNDAGSGVSTSHLYDELGLVGTGAAAQLVDRARSPFAPLSVPPQAAPPQAAPPQASR